MASRQQPPLAALLIALRTARSATARSTAAASLYTALQPSLITACARHLTRAPGPVWCGAEDLAQDTLVDALARWRQPTCPAPINPHGWLAKSAQRALRTRERTAWATPPVDVAEALTPALFAQHGNALEDEADGPPWREAFGAAYDAARDALPPDVRATWVFVVEQDVPVTHAARTLGVSRQTVYRRLDEARARFRSLLAQPRWGSARDATPRAM